MFIIKKYYFINFAKLILIKGKLTILYHENNDNHNIHDFVKNNNLGLIKFYLYDLISKFVITV